MHWAHVVACTDDSDPGLHAIAVARRLAASRGATCTVLTVVAPGEAPAPRVAALDPVVVEGHPGIEISRFVEARNADAVVLGRCSLAPRGTQLGAVADAVIRRSRVPCLIVPAGQDRFDHVIVALDGTERGFSVLDGAEDFSRLTGADLRVITVEPASAQGTARVPRARTLRIVEELKAREAEPGAGRGLHVEVLWGDPVDTIRQALTKPVEDVLVVGAHRGGPAGPPADSTGVGRSLLHTVMSAILTVPL